MFRGRWDHVQSFMRKAAACRTVVNGDQAMIEQRAIYGSRWISGLSYNTAFSSELWTSILPL